MVGPPWIPAGKHSKTWERMPVVEARYSRKPAKEIASGISFREGDLVGARSVELIKVCDFYEAKASGSYADSALCGRYLHAMAREVRALAAALRDTEKRHLQRIRRLETVCREWEQHFGSEVQGELGIVPATPAAVATRTRELEERVRCLEAETTRLEAELGEQARRARRELEDYQAASRDHAERARRRADNELVSLDARRDATLAAIAARCAEDYSGEARRQSDEAAAARAALEASLAEASRRAETDQRETEDLSRRLAAAEASLSGRDRALRSAAVEVLEARRLRREAVDDALEALRSARAARAVDAAVQCPAACADVVRFAWSPRHRTKPGGRRVLASGVPPSLSAQALVAAIGSRLGVDVLSAAPRRAADVDGARVYELLAATAEDAVRLVEAGALPDRPDVASHMQREPLGGGAPQPRPTPAFLLHGLPPRPDDVSPTS